MTQSIGENTPKFMQGSIMLPDTETTANTQRFNQIMGEQALELLNKMKGASSDRDVQVNFKIANDPNATVQNKRLAIQALRARITTLLHVHNAAIEETSGKEKIPTLASGTAAPAAAAAPAATGGDANAAAKAWLDANPNDPRAAAVRAKLGGG
jgi:hypothetical protein